MWTMSIICVSERIKEQSRCVQTTNGFRPEVNRSLAKITFDYCKLTESKQILNNKK